MTDEEKMNRQARDAAICDYYLQGHKVSQCASKFRLGRQRVIQILQKAGAWKPYEKGDRTQFLGVSVSAADKAALMDEAARRGISMSALTADLIKDMLKEVRA